MQKVFGPFTTEEGCIARAELTINSAAAKLEIFFLPQAKSAEIAPFSVVQSDPSFTITSSAEQCCFSGNLRNAIDYLRKNSLISFPLYQQIKNDIISEASQPQMALSLPQVLQEKLDAKGLDCFGSLEHEAIGNAAFASFLAENPTILALLNDNHFFHCASEKLKISSTQRLTAGRLIALYGDFYASEDPISDTQIPAEQEKRFDRGFDSLVNPARPDELKTILDEMEKAKQEFIRRFGAREKPSNILKDFDKLLGPHNRKYALATLGRSGPGYLGLALKNFDHFGEDAKIAFKAGYRVALNSAILAHGQQGAQQAETFTKALAQSLAAAHFLTDLFSSGHMRTPRRAIDRYVQTHSSFFKSLTSSRCAERMHKEDGDFGLMVKVTKPEPKAGAAAAVGAQPPVMVERFFEAFGDGHLLDKRNSQQKAQAEVTVLELLRSVYRTFESGQLKFVDFFSGWVPEYLLDQKLPPMFDVAKVSGAVTLRNDKGEYEQVWSPYRCAFHSVVHIPPKKDEDYTEEEVSTLIDQLDPQEFIDELAHAKSSSHCV